MEGSLFIPPDRPRRGPERTCVECGGLFRPRRVADGVEELCDTCYQAQFQRVRVRRGQQQHRLMVHPR